MGLCGTIDPGNILDYIDCGGYAGLVKVLQYQPENIIQEITKAGLRGRGGAGFPTGLKWDAARRFAAEKKYVICNADDGDPGTYMDRTILESNPHQILEGLAICAPLGRPPQILS
jgi:NADH-quinone oxidoreductase subunit F